MTDIKIGYTVSDYFYTLEPEKIPDHQTCETRYNIDLDASCSFLPISREIKHCILDFSNETGREQCLRDVDVANNNKTQYYKQYTEWLDSSSNCYTAALCQNRKYANKIEQQQSSHLGTEQNYENKQAFLTNEQWKTVQLGVGVVAVIAGIYYMNKKMIPSPSTN